MSPRPPRNDPPGGRAIPCGAVATGFERVSSVIALLIVAASLVAALRWTGTHPLPLWWDEAHYANQAIADRAAIGRGVVAGVKALLFDDPVRPPAYRALVLPFTVVEWPRLALLRAIALGTTFLAMLLVYRASRSALAAAMVFSMPAVLTSGAWFGTEYPLFLAIGLLLAGLVPRTSPLLIAPAVALGLLSKTTFVVIAGPALLAAVLFARRDRRELAKLVIAAACGAAVSAGWWVWHLLPALRFAQLGRTFMRASLGSPLALETLGEKVRIFAFEAVGIVLLMALVAVAAHGWSREQRRTAAIGLAASLPLLLLAFASNVFVPRHFAPAFLPMAVVIAVSLERVRPAVRVAISVLALIQIVAVAANTERYLPRVEQTDWRILRRFVTEERPHVAFLGGWPGLTPPELRYAWTRDGAEADTEWLWRFEDGAIDWEKVMHSALASDAVLVVPPGAIPPRDPRLAVDERTDNRHNAEFMAKLAVSGVFSPPVRLRAGQRHPVDLLLYRRTRSDAGRGAARLRHVATSLPSLRPFAHLAQQFAGHALGEVIGKVGDRDQANQRVGVAVDDREAPDSLGLHDLEGPLDRVIVVHHLQVPRHDLGHRERAGVAGVGEAAGGQIAIRHDPHQPFTQADRDGAAVVLPHEPRHRAQRRIRRATDRIGCHQLANAHDPPPRSMSVPRPVRSGEAVIAARDTRNRATTELCAVQFSTRELT